MGKNIVIRHLFLALALLVVLAAPARAVDFVVVTENNPPFNFLEDGMVRGIAADLFVEMAKEAELPLDRPDIKLWPWARAYAEIQHKPNVFLFATGRTPMREDLFQWIGPISRVDCCIVSRKNAHLRLDDVIEAFERYTIGTIRDSAPEQTVLRMGVSPARLQRLHDIDMNILKLSQGRIDGALFNEPAIRYTIRKMGFDINEYEFNRVLLSTELHFAASRQMDPKIIARLQEALDKLIREGRLQEIMDRYM